jgi:hypothetical protein
MAWHAAAADCWPVVLLPRCQQQLRLSNQIGRPAGFLQPASLCWHQSHAAAAAAERVDYLASESPSCFCAEVLLLHGVRQAETHARRWLLLLLLLLGTALYNRSVEHGCSKTYKQVGSNRAIVQPGLCCRQVCSARPEAAGLQAHRRKPVHQQQQTAPALHAAELT